MDIGWSELLVIGVVALIVVGPKDLPGMFRAIGQFTGKMRRMARDFQRAMDDAADTSGLKDTASGLKNMTSAKSMGLDKLKDAAERFDKWEPPKPKPPAPAGENTEKLRKERAAEAQRKVEEARAAREAREAAAKAPAAEPHEPLIHIARERPGAPTARGARPKNMPKKKPTRGRA